VLLHVTVAGGCGYAGPVGSPGRDEWSVTPNGRYVVRFSGANAQEYARQSLASCRVAGLMNQRAVVLRQPRQRSIVSLPGARGDQR
jgi:hypothetical protein